MHRPSVLFLDEPSTGLDPQARLFVWDRVRELRDEGVTIVLTTHDMDEATELCDRVGIVDHGTLLALDTPTALVRSLPGSGTLELGLRAGPDADRDLVQRLSALPGVERVEPADGPDGTTRVRLFVDGQPAALLARVTEALPSSGHVLVDVSLGELTLEDVFISMTGRGLR